MCGINNIPLVKRPSFHKEVRDARIAADENLLVMARKLGISSSKLTSMECGRIPFTDEVKRRMKELYDVEVKETNNELS